ncbi:hypothetical protein BC940DRAFT_294424 [Gongronella butleri]|nr:hypothetical protein BC940DRAFT_294424 [Gongronella butleri]
MPNNSYEVAMYEHEMSTSSSKTYEPAMSSQDLLHEPHAVAGGVPIMSPFDDGGHAPSPYQHHRGFYHDDHEDVEGDMGHDMHPQATYIERNPVQEDWWLSWLLLFASLSILVFTVIPVVVDFPYIVLPDWFSGDTLFRLFDPLFTVPLNLLVMTRAYVIQTGGRSRYWGNLSEQTVCWLFWSMSMGIFVQGHGVHTAAAMFKHPVQDFNTAHPDIVAAYPVLQQIYSYMRDVWEHIIAHYMYAIGAIFMSWAQIFTFRNQVHEPSTGTKVIFAIGSLVYGLLLAGVAIEFPYGIYVGLVYSVLLGLMMLLLITMNRRGLRRGGLFTMGKRMVLQFYLGASIVGLIIIIVWIAKFGFKNRLDAGVNT